MSDERKLQKTIQQEVALEGIGLHSGQRVRIVFKAAPVGHGIQFVRVDLPGHPRINVTIANVVDAETHLRRSSVGEGGVEVQTVEHLMAALFALEIDNLLIETDGIELPGLDGSALGFLETLRQGGVEIQEKSRHSFRVREPIWVKQNGASIAVFPSEGFRISYALSYHHPRLKSQFYEFVLNGSNFAAEVIPSRTFVLEQEIEYLKKHGLGRGATFENTLVLGEKGILHNTLRFEDEFVRHKILDLVGDLYLLGYPIEGHIIAYRSGHSLNLQLLRKLKEQEETLLHWGIVRKETLPATQMDLETIQRIIPHREPFLFVDKILTLEPGRRAVGVKYLSKEADFFKGHFPNRPIMPGVLIVEAMAQVGGVLVLNTQANLGKYSYFLAMDKVKFRKVVYPGDELLLEVEMVRSRTNSGLVHAKAYVKHKLVAEANLLFALIDA
ncbi:MAG: UDP-3-O-acyl-N-acetylglucosamine deacetylase [Candidatus Omnitrophota bacterium]